MLCITKHILYLFSDLVVVFIQGKALGLVMRLHKPEKKKKNLVKDDIKILCSIKKSKKKTI
jgi:hypothetical protein